MHVEIVQFPETRVACIEHRGPPSLEHETARKLIAWKLENRLLDQEKHRSYGLHYTDPHSTPAAEHRVEFCLSIAEDTDPNQHGIKTKVIPRQRCACARDIGSRADNKAAAYLHQTWLPHSGQTPSGAPLIFHYVNVGPNVRPEDMITDVYLPLLFDDVATGSPTPD